MTANSADKGCFQRVEVLYEVDDIKGRNEKNEESRNAVDREDMWADVQHVTTVHGLDKLTDKCPIKTRRWIWLMVIVASLCIFGYQATMRLLYFLGHPVNMNYKVVTNHSLLFPKVVICNQNSFKLVVFSSSIIMISRWLN
ncbi:hypothetical protein CAPTEDRAFT_215957 [Capitella teleta]|uniref:Uncharacterized protein n=1 Tax=Capitella teleta TaxID=283909 RepID=R7VFP0_CAPTE|nr:hypothetical protein CAPTEDRAFT_215957 [Capitella teleta]|eukprot:ELU15111.1 hypothetical protein CAPTEDRAFT_215957 [Capitella teleta]